jgi:hypothetical protein
MLATPFHGRGGRWEIQFLGGRGFALFRHSLTCANDYRPRRYNEMGNPRLNPSRPHHGSVDINAIGRRRVCC